MTSPIQVLESPYLKLQWGFPQEELEDLANEVEIAYVDIAQKVNDRGIAIYPQGVNVVTGQKWYLDGNTESSQTLRRVYVTGALAPGSTTNIPTNIGDHGMFTHISGVLTDGSNWWPLPFASNSANSSVSIAIGGSPEVITIITGSSFPAVTNSVITLEWIVGDVNFVPDT